MHKLLCALACASLLTACSSGGGSDGNSVDSTQLKQIKSQLIGLWDASADINGVKDERHIYLDEDLVMSNYDYQNDAFDKGENCYQIDPPEAKKDQLIINSPSEAYLIQEGVNEKIADIALSIPEGADTVSLLFYGEDGTSVTNLTRVTSLTKEDLQPVCTQ